MTSRTGLVRSPARRDMRLFVIATEGTYTEPDYFSHLQDAALVSRSRVWIHTLETPQKGPDAGHSDPASVLRRLTAWRDEAKAAGKLTESDDLWLVVDVDRHAEELGAIVAAAGAQRFRAAVSNPCFELWLWLHHSDDVAGIACPADCEDKLRRKLGAYNKSNLDTAPYTKPAISLAIERAKELDGDGTSTWPQDTGSHVYRLLETLFAAR